MDLYRDIKVSRSPLAALAAIGVFWGAFAAMLPQIKADLGVGDAQLGVMLLTAATGALLAMALAPRADARAPRLAITVAGLAMVVIILPLGAMTSVIGFGIILVGIGMATGMLDILGNARIAKLEAHHDLSLMNLNHACYSFAYALAAVLTGIARENGIGTAQWFAAVGLVVLLIITLTYSRRIPEVDGRAPQASRGAIGRHAWLAGLVVLIGFFVENATEGWSALHVERTLNGGAAEGALGPAMLGLTMGVGRLLGHLVTVRGSEMTILRWASVIAALGLLIAAVAPTPLIAYVGFGLLGAGVSIVAPMALALAGQGADPSRRTLAVSRAAMIGYFGFFIGPPLMGLMSEAFGLRVAFGLGAVMVLIIPVLLLPRMRALPAA